MNIAFYYTHPICPDAGGTERVTYALAEALKAHGINSIFISLCAHKKNLSAEKKDHRQYYLPNSKFLCSYNNVEYVKELLRNNDIKLLINQDSFDAGSFFCTNNHFPSVKCITVIHYNLYGAPEYIADTLKENYINGKTNILKYIIQRQLVPLYRLKAYKQRTTLLKKIYENANHVVVLSDADKSIYPVSNKDRLHVISNPLTLPLGHTGHKPKENKVLYVGRMDFSQKRVDRLLRSWQIVEKYKPEWELELLGEGSCLNYYKKLSKKLKLTRVNFRNNQSPSEYYRRSKLLCLTSSYEGFGLVLTEAMQEGVVPVAFKSYDAIDEIITDGFNGVLVSPFDTHVYAEKLIELMEKSLLLEEMSRNAKTSVKKFAIKKIAQQWFDLINLIVNETSDNH